jgi:hypothetical protein
MTARFNQNIIVAANRVQDRRTDPSALGDTGRRYKSLDWQAYQNRAIREIIFDTFKALGAKFGNMVPEYMRTSGDLPVIANRTVRPVDAWIVTEAMDTAHKARVQVLGDDEIIDVIVGKNTLITPTDKRPVLYQEGDGLIILPKPTAITAIVARYIKVHQDIVVNISTTSAGNFLNVGFANYTSATRQLQGVMLIPFADTDIIESRVDADTVVLTPGSVPPGSVATIDQVLVSDNSPDDNDLILKPTWDSQIIDKMVQYASQDASRNINA